MSLIWLVHFLYECHDDLTLGEYLSVNNSFIMLPDGNRASESQTYVAFLAHVFHFRGHSRPEQILTLLRDDR